MKNFVLIILILLSGAAALANSQEAKDKKGDDKGKAAQVDFGKSGPLPSPINVTVTQTNKNDGNKCCDQKTENHDAEWWTAWATVTLAGITAFLAIFTALLWNSTSKLVNDAKKTSIKELRAYVGIVYPEVTIKDEQLVAVVHYENSGETPARDTQVFIKSGIRDGFPPWEDPTDPRDAWRGGLLMPSVTWQRYSRLEGVTYSEQFRKEIFGDSAKKIWVWGTITYTDIFDEKWEVRFRFRSGHDRREEGDRPQPWNQGGQGAYFPMVGDIANNKITSKGKKA